MAQMGRKKRSLIVKRESKWSKKTEEHKITATGSNAPKKPGFFSTVISEAKTIGGHLASGAKTTFTEENRNKLAGFGERMGGASRSRFSGMNMYATQPRHKKRKKGRK